MKKCGGMTRKVKVEFLRKVSFYIVRGCLLHKKRFKQSFLFFIKKSNVYPQAKHIFIAGQTSSQKSESLNDLIKGFGSLKKEMVK